MQSKSIGLLKGFETIRVRAQKVYDDFERFDDTMIEAYDNPSTGLTLIHHRIINAEQQKVMETRMILEEFRGLMKNAFSITGLETNIEDCSTIAQAKGVLSQISIECDMIIGSLNASILPISSEDMDRLSKFRKELSEVSALFDVNYEKNLIEAIVEHEKGHFLASALITARVINYTLDQVEGKTIDEKVKNLRDKSIVKQEQKGKSDEEEFIIKASKKARNIFSHDIRIFVNPSESLSILGDCVRLLRMCSAILSSK